jgi:hypothetical protein
VARLARGVELFDLITIDRLHHAHACEVHSRRRPPIAIAAIAFRARRRFDLVAMEVEQQRQITGAIIVQLFYELSVFVRPDGSCSRASVAMGVVMTTKELACAPATRKFARQSPRGL